MARRAPPRRASRPPKPRARGSAPRGPATPEDALDGIVFALDYLGVRAVAFHVDADGDSGVTTLGPRPRTFIVTDPLVLTDYNLMTRWAQIAATVARGVRA